MTEQQNDDPKKRGCFGFSYNRQAKAWDGPGCLKLGCNSVLLGVLTLAALVCWLHFG